jgi:hypothetical protein
MTLRATLFSGSYDAPVFDDWRRRPPFLSGLSAAPAATPCARVRLASILLLEATLPSFVIGSSIRGKPNGLLRIVHYSPLAVMKMLQNWRYDALQESHSCSKLA